MSKVNKKHNSTARRAWLRSQEPLVCTYCRKFLVIGGAKHAMPTIDHKRPLGRGGDDDPHNWCVACYDCNQKKADKFFGSFDKAKTFIQRAPRVMSQ